MKNVPQYVEPITEVQVHRQLKLVHRAKRLSCATASCTSALISASYPSNQASANTARPRKRASISRDTPVHSLSFRRVSFQPKHTGGLRLSMAGCLVCVEVVYPSEDGHPPKH